MATEQRGEKLLRVLLLVAGSAAAFLAYGKITWITIFFQRTHGLTPGETGFWFGVVNGGAGIAGTVLGGYLADRFGSTNRRHVLTAPAVGMVVTIPFALLAFMTDNWLLALFLLIVPTICNSLYYGPTYSSVQGLVPLRARAIAAAVLAPLPACSRSVCITTTSISSTTRAGTASRSATWCGCATRRT